MQPDTIVMKAITLSQGEGYYLTQHYPEAVATYYNIANAYAYLLKDQKQAKAYYEQFLTLARKEETPTAQLTEMMGKAREMLK